MIVEVHFKEKHTETLTLADDASIVQIMDFLDDFYGKNKWEYYLNGI